MVTITDAQPRDAWALAGLLLEMDQFYGGQILETAETKARDIKSMLLRSDPAARVLLAWEGRELAGMAAYTFLWPALRTTVSLYVKELYVRRHHRGSGVGRLLMQHLFKRASDNGCTRVEWTADEDNAEARRFYEKLGFLPSPSKIFYRAENLSALGGLEAQ
jgi:GNAT superfamily N-acetyltransferase